MGLKKPPASKSASAQGVKPGSAENAQAAKAEEIPIEQQVVSLLGVTPSEPLSQMVQNFFERVLPRVQIPVTSQTILKDFANIDVTSDRIAQTLRGNPYYEYQMFKLIESIRKREDQPTTESAVILYGMQNTRNLILALQMIRMVSGAHPVWDQNGKLVTKPTDHLKFALKMEEQFAGKKGSYSEIAYAAGYLFDVVLMLSQELCEDKKKILGFIDFQFNHALKTANIGLELSKEIHDFGLKKFIFSTCLIHDIGKIVMAILEPTYMDFLDDCAKKDVTRRVREYAESKKFGISHAWLGALVVQQLGVFTPVVPAVFYHHHPYLLKHNKDLFQLANLVCLSTNIARNFKKTDQAEDPVIQKWKTTELKEYQIKVSSLLGAVNRVN